MLFALAALAVSLQPIEAAPLPAPTEDLRAKYYAPPAANETPERAFRAAALEEAGVFQFAAHLNTIESSLSDCITLRREMTALIQTEFGSYAVHPDWLPAYQSCLLARDAEVKALGSSMAQRRPDLLEGLEAEAAARVTDILARLTVYQTRIKQSIASELTAQAIFVDQYNNGVELISSSTE